MRGFYRNSQWQWFRDYFLGMFCSKGIYPFDTEKKRPNCIWSPRDRACLRVRPRIYQNMNGTMLSQIVTAAIKI